MQIEFYKYIYILKTHTHKIPIVKLTVSSFETNKSKLRKKMHAKVSLQLIRLNAKKHTTYKLEAIYFYA